MDAPEARKDGRKGQIDASILKSPQILYDILWHFFAPVSRQPRGDEWKEWSLFLPNRFGQSWRVFNFPCCFCFKELGTRLVSEEIQRENKKKKLGEKKV
jgi:hypothetical protein